MQAVNTALSFFVALLYNQSVHVCNCLSAQCSCPLYPRPVRALSSAFALAGYRYDRGGTGSQPGPAGVGQPVHGRHSVGNSRVSRVTAYSCYT